MHKHTHTTVVAVVTLTMYMYYHSLFSLSEKNQNVARTAITMITPTATSPVIDPALEEVGDGVNVGGRFCSGGRVCVGDGDGDGIAIEQERIK